jgi:TM2 domain-containing membrane protein YozV
MSPFYGDLAAPFGRDLSGRPLSDKSKVSAGLLQIFLGWLGAGRFYTGHTGIALGQLGLTVVGWLTSVLGIGVILVLGAGVWALVDGIVLLSSSSATDSRGLLLHS